MVKIYALIVNYVFMAVFTDIDRFRCCIGHLGCHFIR